MRIYSGQQIKSNAIASLKGYRPSELLNKRNSKFHSTLHDCLCRVTDATLNDCDRLCRDDTGIIKILRILIFHLLVLMKK